MSLYYEMNESANSDIALHHRSLHMATWPVKSNQQIKTQEVESS